jgi:pyruvate/2-oxoacid:ferredoxin oxidoreductase beta subunit
VSAPAPAPAFTRYDYFLPGGWQCPGCGGLLATKIALQTIFETAPNALVFGASCGAGRSPIRLSGLGLRGSGAVGLKAALGIRGIDRPVVVIGGEGQTFDMGLDDLSGAFMSGYPFMAFVLDNQAYSSSGGHRTGTTEWLARTKIHPGGVRVAKKHPCIMMAYSGARYVATASPYFIDDFTRKVRLAMEHMPSLVHVYTPCVPSRESDPKDTVLLARLAVQTGLFPLYEALDGRFQQTTSGRRPMSDYVERVGQFGHLKADDVAGLERYAASLGTMIDDLVADTASPRVKDGGEQA